MMDSIVLQIRFADLVTESHPHVAQSMVHQVVDGRSGLSRGGGFAGQRQGHWITHSDALQQEAMKATRDQEIQLVHISEDQTGEVQVEADLVVAVAGEGPALAADVDVLGGDDVEVPLEQRGNGAPHLVR